MTELGINFPNYADYNRSIDKLSAQFIRDGGIATTLELFSKQQSRQDEATGEFLEFTTHLASVLEPVDRVTQRYVDENTHISDAVFSGSFIGWMLTKDIYGDTVPTREILQQKISVIPNDQNDPYQMLHEMSARLCALGDEGLLLFDQEAIDKLEVWEELMVAEIRAQRYFRRSIGFIALHAQAAYSALELQRFEQYFANGDDGEWEKGLQELGI